MADEPIIDELPDVNRDSKKRAIRLLSQGYTIAGFVMRNENGDVIIIDSGQIVMPIINVS